MKVELTRSEIATIKHAFYLAAQWEESYIDALTMEYGKGKHPESVPKVVPSEYKPWARKSRATIRRMEKLKLKLP